MVLPAGAAIRRHPAVAILLLSLTLLTALGAWAQSNVISQIVIHGNRRIPAETIRAHIFTRPGDVYDAGRPGARLSIRCGTPAISRTCASSGEETSKGWIHSRVREGEAHDPRNSLRGAVIGFPVRRAGAASRSGRSVSPRNRSTIPTKVKKAEVASEGAAGRTWTPVRHRAHGSSVRFRPAAVAVTFVVKEGPKVKVGRIRFEGNRKVSSRYLRSAMKNLHPIGIPHSIFLENLISRTYDASKLNEDTERVRDAYQRKGYFKALVEDPKTQDARLPERPGFTFPCCRRARKSDRHHDPGRGRTAIPAGQDHLHRQQGDQRHDRLAPAVPHERWRHLQYRPGAQGPGKFAQSVRRTGIHQLHPGAPIPRSTTQKHLITLNIDLDEGKPFYVRRIEFQGNTTTRDKVIRRELAIEEGQVYNTRLWELSLLRLESAQLFRAAQARRGHGTQAE